MKDIPKPHRRTLKGSTHEAFYTNEPAAQEAIVILSADPHVSGITLARASNHDWMQEGEVYWMVRWNRVAHVRSTDATD